MGDFPFHVVIFDYYPSLKMTDGIGGEMIMPVPEYSKRGVCKWCNEKTRFITKHTIAWWPDENAWYLNENKNHCVLCGCSAKAVSRIEHHGKDHEVLKRAVVNWFLVNGIDIVNDQNDAIFNIYGVEQTVDMVRRAREELRKQKIWLTCAPVCHS